MIDYKTNRVGFVPIMQMSGSIVPRSFSIAAAPAIFAILLRIFLDILEWELMDTEFKKESFSKMYSTFFWFLGFILVFRTTAAYNRYWDGVNHLSLMAVEWYDACSHMCAFAASSDQPEKEKTAFCDCIVRLFSLMHALAMQEIAVMENEDFEILDVEGFDVDLLEALNEMDDPADKKCLVSQWIQRVVIEAMNSGFINAEAPIVTRCFQELNSGMTSVARMRTIGQIQFPFPYAQMVTYSLILFSVMTPVFFCNMNIHPAAAGVGAFVAVICPYALNLIATEIEQPFGDDPNDLRCNEAQEEMNRALMNLLKPLALSCPKYRWCPKNSSLKDTGRKSLRRMSSIADITAHRSLEPSSEPSPDHSARVDIESGVQQESAGRPQPHSPGADPASGDTKHEQAQVASLCRSEARAPDHEENERQQIPSVLHQVLPQHNDTAAVASGVQQESDGPQLFFPDHASGDSKHEQAQVVSLRQKPRQQRQQQQHQLSPQLNDTAALATAVLTAALDSSSSSQMPQQQLPQQPQPHLHLHMPVEMRRAPTDAISGAQDPESEEMVEDSVERQKQSHQQMQYQEQRKQWEEARALAQSTPNCAHYAYAHYQQEYLDPQCYPHEEWMAERSARYGFRPWSAPGRQPEYPELVDQGFPPEELMPKRSAPKSRSVPRALPWGQRPRNLVRQSRDPPPMLGHYVVPHPSALVRVRPVPNTMYLE